MEFQQYGQDIICGESSLKFIKKTSRKDIIILKIITIIFLILGSAISSTVLWNVTDIMVGLMAIINIYAIFALRNIVLEEYKYWKQKN